jgi:hypothetical protein
MIKHASVAALALLLAACSPTRISFDGPPNTVMFVNDKPYHLPTQVEFLRPAGVGDHNRYNISLVFNTPLSGEIHAKGYIDVYGYTESEMDKLVTNNCKLNDSELDNLAAGKTLVYKLQTSSRQPLADLTLTKQ